MKVYTEENVTILLLPEKYTICRILNSRVWQIYVIQTVVE